MPHRDPEARREYERLYRERNREKVNEYKRRWQAANRDKTSEYERRWRAKPESRELIREQSRRRVRDPEKVREYQRQYSAANSERKAEYRRRRRQENPERIREMDKQSKQKNAERVREYMYKYSRQRRARGDYLERERELQRQWRAQNKDRTALAIMKRNHGMGPDDWAAMWDAQEGLCYLCGREMNPARTHIDHDHRCCPAGTSCGYCRRGLAHQLCNALIGMANDDPALLRVVADNLEVMLRLVDARLAAKPVQSSLDDQPEAAVAVEALPAPSRLRAVAEG